MNILEIRKFLHGFSGWIIALGDNAAFVALLATVEDVPAKWLIYAHLILIGAKAYYYKDKTVTATKDESVQIEVKPTTKYDIWQN